MRATSAARVPGGRDQAVMARMFVYLFGLGGVLVLATLPLNRDPLLHEPAIVVTGCVALAIALLFLIVFDRLPPWVFRVAPGTGALLVAVIVYHAGPSAAPAYLFFLLWVSLSATYFFGLKEALANAVWASGTATAALLLEGGTQNTALLVTMVTGTMLVNAIVMVALRHQLEVLLERLDHAARTDFLTRLANRREFNDRFDYEIARVARTGRGLALLVFDLDGFKLVNDRYGHHSGDRALESFAEVLRANTRKMDIPARIGGEEFALLAPETGLVDAVALGDRIRTVVESDFIDVSGLTVSCGVATCPEAGNSAESLMRAADRALYGAKEAGRNRVAAYSSSRHGRDEGGGDPGGFAFSGT